MGVSTGTQLGPYEILSAIGAGGMGEVYRARDTRLDRVVAIKVLPAHLADRAELRERFEREARTIASLNHPHICTLHDIGHQDGIDFLVMEYLEGETLAQRLLKGSLPLEQVLQYAIEIADALDKAHRKGVTHRDLKPGNIMLTKTGTKLLDFGLAKLKQAVAPPNVQLSELPTANDPLTAQGTIVGTLQYMAPEQLEGKEVDARTDVFAFGAVVYEMVTGKKAFEGKSQASLIAAIMHVEPPGISVLQPMTPPQLNRVVKTCLTKEPDGRWQTASDLCRELKWIAEGGAEASKAAISETKPLAKGWRRPVPLSLAALIAVAIAVAVAAIVWNLRTSVPQTAQTVMRFTLTLPPNERVVGVPAFSADGTHVAYVAIREDRSQQLYLQQVGSLEAKPIPGIQGGTGPVLSPVFSPDGQWVAFEVGRKLKKIPITGGEPLTLCDLQNERGISWGPRDMIVFTDVASPGIWQVSASGGTPKLLIAPDPEKAESFYGPELLPGGKAVLFTAGDELDWGEEQVVVQELGTGNRRVLAQGGTNPHYLPSGYLAYVREGTLMAAPFDLASLQLSGTPVPVVEGVGQSLGIGNANYGVAANGSLVYVPAGAWQQNSTLVWEDRKGSVQPLPTPPGVYIAPRLSPDGHRVTVAVVGARSQVWVHDISNEKFTRFTFEGANRDSLWTSDGRHIAYASLRGGSWGIFWKPADGTGAEESLLKSRNRPRLNSFSPDGRILAFSQSDPKTGSDIWVLPLDGERKPRPFLQTPAFEGGAMFSPDGRWLAYTSDESMRDEVYVQAFPGPGGKWQVSTDGGQQPRWARSGRELFYLALDQQKVMAVDITTQPTFSASKPRLISQAQGFSGIAPPYYSNYDVAPDGQRFLRVKTAEWGQLPAQLNVVLNWSEELKRRVPTGTK